jgi:N-acetylglutamate synthase-like GNAT family acetyltransferase
VKNDGTQESALFLLLARNILRQGLYDIPVDYITRWVFDPAQETGLALRDGVPAGALCFSPYPTHHFAEIAFLAVDHSEQRNGIGHFLIKRIQMRLQPEGFRYIVTSADNEAIGFFTRVGFSTKFPDAAPKNYFQAILPPYDRATLMVMVLDEEIDYENLDDWLDAAAAKVEDIEDEEVDALPPGPITHIRGIPIPPRRNNTKPISAINQLFEEIWENEVGRPFRQKMSPAAYPEDRKDVPRPMDLSMIKTKVERRVYQDMAPFFADLKLMFANCHEFCREDAPERALATELEAFVRWKCSIADVEFD